MKKLISLCLALVLILSLSSTALAAKNKKVTELDIPAVLADVKTKGKANIYHWWTAGGEKQAIQEIIKGFEADYEKQQAKSNAIPGGAGGAMAWGWRSPFQETLRTQPPAPPMWSEPEGLPS